MTRVVGLRGELLSLVSYLPRCQSAPCPVEGRLPPIATFESKTADGRLLKLCGRCTRAHASHEVAALPYRRLLRWLLRVIGGGQVVDGGRTITLVAPDAELDALEELPTEETHPVGTKARRIPPLPPSARRALGRT